MNPDKERLTLSPAPHLSAREDTANIHKNVIIALIPQLLVSIWIFGWRALVLTAACTAFCVIFEWVIRRVLGRSSTIGDLSAVITGILLAFCLPVSIPLWMAAVGCFSAIVVVKQLFGGLGQNFANPANTARIVLLLSFPTAMNSWAVTSRMSEAVRSAAGIEGVTGPTPLMLFAENKNVPTNMDLFLGRVNGPMGEISGLALLIGGAWLIYKKIIGPEIPASFIGTVALMSLIMGMDPLFHILAGGVMLGAFFMACDYTTSPVTASGKIIFGIGCGLFTMLIRAYAIYPEGVPFAILLMNILTPLIDRVTRIKPVRAENRKGGEN